MMKSHVFLKGSSAGLASIMQIDSSVGFFLDRRLAIDLCPLPQAARAGYIWKRVFLNRGARSTLRNRRERFGGEVI